LSQAYSIISTNFFCNLELKNALLTLFFLHFNYNHALYELVLNIWATLTIYL